MRLPLLSLLFLAGQVAFSAFGVFDGHGGRQVATFASNSLLKAVMAAVDASAVPLQVRRRALCWLGVMLLGRAGQGVPSVHGRRRAARRAGLRASAAAQAWQCAGCEF